MRFESYALAKSQQYRRTILAPSAGRPKPDALSFGIVVANPVPLRNRNNSPTDANTNTYSHSYGHADAKPHSHSHADSNSDPNTNAYSHPDSVVDFRAELRR